MDLLHKEGLSEYSCSSSAQCWRLFKWWIKQAVLPLSLLSTLCLCFFWTQFCFCQDPWQMQIQTPSHWNRAEGGLRPGDSSRIFLSSKHPLWSDSYSTICHKLESMLLPYDMGVKYPQNWSIKMVQLCHIFKHIQDQIQMTSQISNLKVKLMTRRDIWAIWNGPCCLFNSIDLT